MNVLTHHTNLMPLTKKAYKGRTFEFTWLSKEPFDENDEFKINELQKNSGLYQQMRNSKSTQR